jgi:uncharacterized protein
MPAALAPPLIQHREAIEKLCHAFGVVSLEVFGSAADGRFDAARSDFDFIARFDHDETQSLGRRYVGLCEGLELLLGRHVDLLTDKPIENPYFRNAVEASRREFYVRTAAQTPA